MTGSQARPDLGIAVVGVGHWGPNVLRDLSASPGARIVAVCDTDPARLAWVAERYPAISCLAQPADLWCDAQIDAVAICTPAESHFALARAALEAGRHVLVEKPLCLSRQEAEQLVAEAERRSLTLMVGHQLLYHPAVEWLHGLAAQGWLGTPRHVSCTRHNIGGPGESVGPWWSLAAHDLSVVLYLLDRRPLGLSGTRARPEEAPPASQWARAQLRLEGDVTAHFSCAVGAAERCRRIVVEGDEGAAVFDESTGAVSLQFYRRDELGVLRLAPRGTEPALPAQYSSDLSLAAEFMPLRLECEHFIRCCRDGQVPRSSGLEGVRVVELLEAGENSMGPETVQLLQSFEARHSALN